MRIFALIARNTAYQWDWVLGPLRTPPRNGLDAGPECVCVLGGVGQKMDSSVPQRDLFANVDLCVRQTCLCVPHSPLSPVLALQSPGPCRSTYKTTLADVRGRVVLIPFLGIGRPGMWPPNITTAPLPQSFIIRVYCKWAGTSAPPLPRSGHQSGSRFSFRCGMFRSQSQKEPWGSQICR